MSKNRMEKVPTKQVAKPATIKSLQASIEAKVQAALSSKQAVTSRVA